jgi:hypothetical protein
MRYSNAKIPRHTRKIIISNLPLAENLLKNCSDTQDMAIKRRIWSIMHCLGRTYQPAPGENVPLILHPHNHMYADHFEPPNNVDHIDNVVQMLDGNDDDLFDFNMEMFDDA